ncbi:MAG: tetratricopeptide repeat protein [Planctomycetia bacterium]|nr:tetratricopeptide repeat protein [Planctomycetia bacterium]
MLRLTMLCGLLICASLGDGTALAQGVGEKIYVINNTELKSGANTIGRVTAGNILTIEDVQRGWYRVDHKSFSVRGWILRRDTVSVADALNRFTAEIETRPTPFAYTGRALIRKNLGEFELALRDLDAALQLEPGNPYALHTRGVLWMKQKQWARSIPDFENALRLTSDPAVQGSANHNLGIARLRLKDLDKAVANFDAAGRLDPLNNADAIANRGEARNFMAGGQEQALVDLNETLRLNPKHEKAWSMRATHYQMRGDWDQALADFSQALLLTPRDVAALSNRGIVWENKKDPVRAMADFDAATQIDPTFAPAYHHRALLFEQQGDFAQAEAALDEFVRLNENQARVLALVIRAGFHARRQLVAKAQADIAEALQIVDHTQAEPLREIAWLLATCPTAELRNGAQAVELAQEACELTHFTNPAALNALAAAYAESGDFPKAIAAQTKTVALTDDARQRATYQKSVEQYLQNLPPGHRGQHLVLAIHYCQRR